MECLAGCAHVAVTEAPFAIREVTVLRIRAVLLTLALAASAGRVAAQTTFDACYVPSVGAIYLIKQAGLPSACLAQAHVAFTWASGGGGSGATDHGALTGLTDDDHSQYLLANGARSATDGFAVTGTVGTGALAASGAGARLLWYPRKAAFRAGEALSGGAGGPAWDDIDIGTYSVALGANTLARGTGSLAAGSLSSATGFGSTALGLSSSASGAGATAMGSSAANADYTTAMGQSSAHSRAATAMGNRSRAVGLASTAIGDSAVADREYATAIGRRTFAGGIASTALGDSTTASGQYATAMGRGSRASGPGSTAGGFNSIASGDTAVAFGTHAVASGAHATAFGWWTAAQGEYSTALGGGTMAFGQSSTAMGATTRASGSSSTAMGLLTTAFGDYSTATGYSTYSAGTASTAMGWTTRSEAYASLAIGRFNVIGGSPTSWIATDPLLVAGNGFDASSRSNALTLFKNGNMTIAGTLTQSSDLRYKEAIEPLDSALSGVLRLDPIYYRFREGTGHPTERRIGLGAQDVERIFPELVHRDSQGYLSVAYTDLAAVLVRAVQEQQERHEALLDEVKALRAELAALRAAAATGGSK